MAKEQPARFAIHGASGRVGKEFCAAYLRDPSLPIHAALTRANSRSLNQDWGTFHGMPPCGIALSHEWPESLDGVIDFSAPEASIGCLERCVERKLALLVATTGFSQAQHQRLIEASEHIALLIAANTSLGMALLRSALRHVAERLPSSYAVEVVEAHHRQKRDAPSGTALELGRIFADAKAKPLEALAKLDRQVQPGGRTRDEIGFSSIRGGQLVGQHDVMLIDEREQLQMSHRANHRSIYVQGALQAAMWLYNKGKGRAAGIYRMEDVLDAS